MRAFLTVLIWGLPVLLGLQSLLEFFRVPILADPIFPDKFWLQFGHINDIRLFDL